MLEMSGSENIPHCPRVVVRLIESSHDPLSSGYTYDSVPPGRAVMEHDTISDSDTEDNTDTDSDNASSSHGSSSNSNSNTGSLSLPSSSTDADHALLSITHTFAQCFMPDNSYIFYLVLV